jgi:hypothetical protein
MTKQETSTRAVTKSDLTVVGEAIDLTYPLYSRLIQIKVRRLFIKRALTGKGKPVPPDINIRTLDGPEAEEDRAAVERHLREGTRLLEGLTRSKAVG